MKIYPAQSKLIRDFESQWIWTNFSILINPRSELFGLRSQFKSFWPWIHSVEELLSNLSELEVSDWILVGVKNLGPSRFDFYPICINEIENCFWINSGFGYRFSNKSEWILLVRNEFQSEALTKVELPVNWSNISYPPLPLILRLPSSYKFNFFIFILPLSSRGHRFLFISWVLFRISNPVSSPLQSPFAHERRDDPLKYIIGSSFNGGSTKPERNEEGEREREREEKKTIMTLQTATGVTWTASAREGLLSTFSSGVARRGFQSKAVEWCIIFERTRRKRKRERDSSKWTSWITSPETSDPRETTKSKRGKRAKISEEKSRGRSI